METPIAQITRRYPASERGGSDSGEDGGGEVHHERKEDEGKVNPLSAGLSSVHSPLVGPQQKALPSAQRTEGDAGEARREKRERKEQRKKERRFDGALTFS